MKRIARRALLVGVCACGTTDFSRPGGGDAASDAPPFVPPSADAGGDAGAPADAEAGLPVYDGGPIDCATVFPTPLFCTPFTASPASEGFVTVGGSQLLQLSNARSLSSPTSLRAATAPADGGAVLAAAYRSFPGAPGNRVVVSAAFLPDVAGYAGLGTAVLLHVEWTGLAVYVDVGPAGLSVKTIVGGSYATLGTVATSALPTQAWTRITMAVTGGGPPRVDVRAGSAAVVSNAAASGAIAPGFTLQVGLKYVDVPTASWSVYVDDLAVWAE
jgi:hypothetical protein